MLLATEMEEGTMSQGKRGGKLSKLENPPVKLSNGTWSCLHITFSPVQLLLYICLPKTRRVNLCYFKPISFVVVICYRGK